MGEQDWFREFIRITEPSYEPSYKLRLGIDRSLSHFVSKHSRPGADLLGRHSRRPRLNPTKGYRGAHKLFRGGSR